MPKKIRIWTTQEFINDFSKQILIAILGTIVVVLINNFPFFNNAFNYVDLRYKFLDTYYLDRKTVNSTTKEEMTKREFIGGFQIYNQGTNNAEEIRGSIQNLPGSLENAPTHESTEECSINSEGPQNDRFIAKCKRLSAKTGLRVFFLFNKRPNFSQTSIAVTSKHDSGKPYNAPHPGQRLRLLYWIIFTCVGLLILIAVGYIILYVWGTYYSVR
jgi:hypothetical protein